MLQSATSRSEGGAVVHGRHVLVTAVFLAAALTLAMVAAASPVAKRQQVVVNQKEGKGKGTFALVPLNPGSLSGDAGTYTWVISSKKAGTADGQGFVRYDSVVTYEGDQGTFVVREVATLVAVAIGAKVGTGTWNVLRGTGVYEGVRGGGRLAAVTGIVTPDLWRYEGFLTAP
jgi:hypothetical protein